MSLAKKQLRTIYLQKRNDLDSKLKQIKDEQIFCNVVQYLKNVHKTIKHIGIYYAFGSEVNTLNIMQYCLQHHYVVYLAKVIDLKNQKMEFVQIKNLDFNYELLYQKIKQPKSNLYVNKNLLDLIFVPIVGFDLFKYRLGYGFGYYDKYLNKIKAIKVGLAYDLNQIDKKIEFDAFDVPLDVIITESRKIE